MATENINNTDPLERDVMRWGGGGKERFCQDGFRVLCSVADCYRMGRYYLRPCHHAFCILHAHLQLDSMTYGIGLSYGTVRSHIILHQLTPFLQPPQQRQVVYCALQQCGRAIECIVVANDPDHAAIAARVLKDLLSKKRPEVYAAGGPISKFFGGSTTTNKPSGAMQQLRRRAGSTGR